MPAYALNSDDCEDHRVSRNTLVHLPSAYNYWVPAFYGGTITQLAISSEAPTGLTLLATYPRSLHVRHAPARPR